MPRKNKIDIRVIIFAGLLPPLIFMLSVLLFMFFEMFHASASTTNYHDIYHFEKIPKNEADEYLTRLDINNTIKELDISTIIPFFNQYTNDTLISTLIIEKAIEYNIPVNIAFSVVWKESSFNPKAINKANRNGSADWGLFQLNDKYYKWSREDFFDIEKNISAGVAHYEYCLDEMQDIQLALAAYNAGVTGVRNYGIPKTTERYITEILEYEDTLNKKFNEYIRGQNGS